MIKKIGLGIVIFNNPKEQVAKLIKSIERACTKVEGCEFQLYLWNNGKKLNYEIETGLHLNDENLSNKVNVGFGKAHNKLMKSFFDKKGDYYIAINPDGFLHINCLANLINMADDYESNAMIEAKQCPVEHPKPYNPLTFDTSWISGACFLYPAKIYKKVAGFDENLFLYCEDVDLSWSVKQAGFQLKICPTAWFYHDTSGRTANPIKDEQLFLAGRYLSEKWGCAEFRELIDSIMVERGMVPTAQYLPDLSDIKKHELNSQIVEFRRMFHFCSPRWTI